MENVFGKYMLVDLGFGRGPEIRLLLDPKTHTDIVVRARNYTLADTLIKSWDRIEIIRPATPPEKEKFWEKRENYAKSVRDFYSRSGYKGD